MEDVKLGPRHQRDFKSEEREATGDPQFSVAGFLPEEAPVSLRCVGMEDL